MGIHPKDNFEAVAASQSKVALEIDADIAEYLKTAFSNWQEHANGLLRFYMDTSQQMEAGPDAWEPREMQEPPGPIR